MVQQLNNTKLNNMTREEVCESLCSYDPRNPIYKVMLLGLGCTPEKSPPPRRSDCYCDSCFHGTDKLAVELLKYMEQS